MTMKIYLHVVNLLYSVEHIVAIVVGVQEEIVTNCSREGHGAELYVLGSNVKFSSEVVDELDFFCKTFRLFALRRVQKEHNVRGFLATGCERNYL